MKASAHMVRLDGSDSAGLHSGRSDFGARPTGRTGAQFSLQQTSGQLAARTSNGASVQSAVSSTAASSGSEADQKTQENSQTEPSFDSILREFDTETNDNPQDAKDDPKKKDDSNSSNVLTAPVAVATPVKEIPPIVFALPTRIPGVETNTVATAQTSQNSALQNTASQNAPLLNASQNAIDEAEPAAEPEQQLAARIAPPAPPPLPESTPIIPRGDIAFTAKLTQNSEENAKPQVAPAAHASQSPVPPIQKAAVAAAMVETAAVERIAEPIVRTLPFAAEIVNAAHASAAPKIDAGLPLNAAAAISKLADALELPAAPPANSANEIVVRIPDATDRGTDVRFVERAGEVNVTVRTTDSEMAQSLRSGLGDLSARLEQNGIRAEMWKPGSDNSSPQDESSRRWNDQKNANGQRQSADSEENQKNSKRPKWVEALEFSLGRSN